jgi:hypothetical protein
MTTPAVSYLIFRDLSHTTATAIRFLARGPPPWSVEETDACFIVRDANGQRSPTSILTRDEAWLPRDRKDRLRGGAI